MAAAGISTGAFLAARMLCTGTILPAKERRAKPRLWIFPASMNAGKAHLALRISTLWSESEVKWISLAGPNYKPDFARLNPNMTVPVLEVEDKVITDSGLIVKYLAENHAGPGDRRVREKGQTFLARDFIHEVEGWDEALYSYGKMKSAEGDLSNRWRILRLKQELNWALQRGDESLAQDYLQKLAQVTVFSDATGRSAGEQKQRMLVKNAETLRTIWQKASSLLQRQGDSPGFLFGPDLSSADTYLMPILLRMSNFYPEDFKVYGEQFPLLVDYWKRAKATEECKVVIKYTKARIMPWVAASQCLPCSFLGMKLGCIRMPSLPPQVQQQLERNIADRKARMGLLN